MGEKDWNPDLYLKYGKERIQPSIDLVRRIELENPKNIIDIGCGPGNSTQILVQRWPGSDITGVDSSRSMIEKAGQDYPEQQWEICDAGKDTISGTYDIVFSNAVIQWIPNHADLLKRFHKLLSEKGVLAVQVPLFWDMPLGKSIAGIAKDKRWAIIKRSIYNFYEHTLLFFIACVVITILSEVSVCSYCFLILNLCDHP